MYSTLIHDTRQLKRDVLSFSCDCICTHSYLYKRWVLSQARFSIDPCKMPESTLSVEGHWETWVNTNQREWWLIDPFPPGSPSMKCRASSSFPSRPNHPSQPLWACCDPHFLSRMFTNWDQNPVNWGSNSTWISLDGTLLSSKCVNSSKCKEVVTQMLKM